MFRFLILFLFFSSGAWAKSSVTCSNRTWDELQVKFCMGSPAGGDSDALIVYFHGLGGDEREWFDNPSMKDIQKKMIANGLDPWVITISYGEAWLLTEVDGSYELLKKTMDELLPDIQKQIRPAGFKTKYLVGASMGGFNTTQVLFKRTDAFDKYMLICPAITTVGPFSTQDEVVDYIRRTGAEPKRVGFMIEWGLMEFPNIGDWNKHSPLFLADQAQSLPRVYVSCGLKDEFGFQEGAEAFFKKINYKAKASWWVPIPNGNHCSFDKKSILKFLLEK